MPSRYRRIASGLPVLVQAIAFALLGRLVSTAAFGEYALTYALVSLFALLSTRWAEAAQCSLFPGPGHDSVRPSTRTPERQSEARIRKTSDFAATILLPVALSLAAALAGLLLLHVTRAHLSPGLRLNLHYGLLALPLVTLSCPILNAVSLLDRSRLGSRLQGWLPASGMVLGLLLMVVMRLGPAVMFAGAALANAIAVTTLRPKLAAFGLPGRYEFVLSAGRRVLRDGLPVMMPALGWCLVLFLDRFLLALADSPESVGTFTLTWALADRIVLLVLVVCAALPRAELVPKATAEPGADPWLLGKGVARYLKVGLPVLVASWLLSPSLCALVFPASYSGASRIMPWLVLIGLGFGLSRWVGVPLLMAGHTARYWRITASGVASCLFLNLFLIPFIGMTGAALATCLAVTMTVAALARAGRELIPWRLTKPQLSGPLVSAVVMAGTLAGVSVLFPDNAWATLLKLSLGGLSYWGANLLVARLTATYRLPLATHRLPPDPARG